MPPEAHSRQNPFRENPFGRVVALYFESNMCFLCSRCFTESVSPSLVTDRGHISALGIVINKPTKMLIQRCHPWERQPKAITLIATSVQNMVIPTASLSHFSTYVCFSIIAVCQFSRSTYPFYLRQRYPFRELIPNSEHGAGQKVYTSPLICIYLCSDMYIPFAAKVYRYCQPLPVHCFGRVGLVADRARRIVSASGTLLTFSIRKSRLPRLLSSKRHRSA